MDDIMTTGQKWATAESTGDTAALAELVTEDFRVIGPVGFTLDRPQYLGRYQGGFTPESVSWDEVDVREYGAAAVTVATVTQRASFQNQRADGTFRVGHLFVRDGDRWRIANVQYSMIGGPSPFQQK
ncbi:MAG TPA: nuclear transport factor 2 family protein [Mycobacteriales bacterium]|jgi:ketosteroid isomerase-like protein|nr:nuclear transport factor 2 family protein [Mycobacteriales bacterium]